MQKEPLPYPQEPKGSAHGKAILVGEHAVVYGVPGIALPLPLSVTVTLGKGNPLPGVPRSWLIWFEKTSERLTGIPYSPCESSGNLPKGVGLGSSAAFTVASLKALLHFAPLDLKTLLILADEGERIFHGNPSGIDVRTVLSQTPLWFQRTPQGLKTDPLPPPRSPLYISLWLTPPGPPTREMVERVRTNLEASGMEESLSRAQELVERVYTSYCEGDPIALGKALTSYHEWLKHLGASTPLLDRLVGIALTQGALGAKITGAGGGGALLLLWATPPPLLPELPKGTIVLGPWPLHGEGADLP